MVGDAQYNFSNFNSKERAVLCSGVSSEKVYRSLQEEKYKRKNEFFYGIYDMLGD